MEEKYSVCLSKIITDQQLEILCCDEKVDEIFLYGPDINRPGLELAGYADNFANDDFGVSLTNSDTLYTLNVLSSGLKPKTLKVNGEGILLEEVAVQDGIASGREYSLYCEDIFSLSVEGEFQRDENIQKQSIHNLGATVEVSPKESTPHILSNN